MYISRNINFFFTLHWYSISWPKSENWSAAVTTKNCVHVYRACQILNKLCNVVYGTLSILVVKINLGLLITASTVALIRFIDRLDYISIAYVSCLLVAGLIFTPLAGQVISLISITSCTVDKSLPGLVTKINLPNEREVQSRSVESLPLISSKLGNLYKMDATAKLTFVDSLVNGIVCALLSY